MSTKALVSIFVGLMVLGIGGFLISNLQNPSNTESPTPTSSDVDLFGSEEKVPTGQPQNMQPQTQKKQYSAFPGVLSTDQLTNKKAVLQTTKGVIEFEIYPDAPKAASNFITLTNDKFYDGLTFHRVESWVVQGGDPTGTGRGGPGYKFEDEPVTKSYVRGIVAMANAGPNTNGSQFFILTKDTPLPPSYTIFGMVTTGMEVVDQITVGDKMQSVSIVSMQ